MTIHASTGARITVAANQRLFIDDLSRLWVVRSGNIEVFAVGLLEGEPVGPRRWLFTATESSTLCAIPVVARDTLALVAIAASECDVDEYEIAAICDAAQQSDDASAWAADLLDSWIEAISAAIARVEVARISQMIEPGGPRSFPAERRIGVREDVVWVRCLRGLAFYVGQDALWSVHESSGAIPLADGSWILTRTDVELETYSTQEWMRRAADWSDFDAFRVAVANWTGSSERALRASERERRLRRANTNREMKDTALAALMGAMTTSFPVHDMHVSTRANALLEVCRTLGKQDGIEFVPPAQWEVDDGVRNPLGAICSASRVRWRRVVLRGDWWRRDSGSFLCRFRQGSIPVAAIRDRRGRYDLHDPATGTTTRVNAQVAELLEPFGVVFYRPLPAVPVTTMTLVRFVLAGMGGSLWNIALIALVAGALGLFMPIAMGFVFDQVIPSNMRDQLGQVFIGLTIAALSAQTFELVRAFMVLRLEGRSATMMQAAVFDRLLQLPAPFFQRYTVGDLVQRVNGVSQVRLLMSSGTITVLLGGLTGMLNFILLFYFSARLAFVALALAVVVCGVVLYLSWTTKKLQDQIQDVTGKLAGLVFQLVSGIAKLRVSGAEDRAMAMWARRYVEKVRLEQRVSAPNGLVVLVTAAVPLLASIVTFAVVGAAIDTPNVLDVASFVAFNSALGAFLAAAMATSNTVINAIQVVPLMRRASAILMEPPEVTAERPGPGRLTGRIEGRNLSFRYRPDTPQVLNNITFFAEPGEFIAFVGPSGSGKSTTLRLLLGFEQPDTGAVYYDGQDLSSIDVAAVRRQMGVVLQSSRLMAGDVFTNIIGALPLTIGDAWEAAEMAGFADDVRDMPLGMHTMISEGGSTLSGGQRQRLLIARALAHKPRIILFDEATSALDNRTQAMVTASLARMRATRIVIAHRLSTVQHADRVYVIEEGRIVESGSPAELMALGGSFAKLAARQLA